MNDLELARHLHTTGTLTDGELDAWKLHRINKLSYRAIAFGTDRSFTTIRDRVRNAQRKIDRARREAA